MYLITRIMYKKIYKRDKTLAMTMRQLKLIMTRKKLKRQFDNEDYKGVVFTQKDVLCNMQDKADIPASCMLLDSQSTMEVFCNTKMLTIIHDVKRHLVLHCNAGTTSVTKKGALKRYGTVWYHPDGFVISYL